MSEPSNEQSGLREVFAGRTIIPSRTGPFAGALLKGLVVGGLLAAAPREAWGQEAQPSEVEPDQAEPDQAEPDPEELQTQQDAAAEAELEEPPSVQPPGARTLRSWIPEIHGFVSQGFLKSSQNNFLAQSERGSFEFNEVGLNFTEKITDRFRIGMQLFMRDLGPIGNYKPQFDWFYLDYQFFDWLGLRAGRTKIPFGLYNEINDVDAARVPILLPQSVYPTQNRDYLLAQTGFEVYGRTPYSSLGVLEYRAYGGTIYLDASDADNIENFEVPYVIGGRLMWETPLEGLRLGGTYQRLSLDGDNILAAEAFEELKDQGVLPPDAVNRIPFRVPAQLWVASIEYMAHDWLIAAEYGGWHLKLESEVPAVLPPTELVSERMYVMASYQVAPWFSPGAYYALLFPNVDERSNREDQQHDLALTMRFDPVEHWILKAEGHYLSGTAYLNADLNGGTPPSQLPRNWAMFLLKTTAYF